MSNLLINLGKGFLNRKNKFFRQEYSVFDIGWVKEKILKHQTDQNLKFHTFKNKYKVAFKDGPVLLISITELFINEFYKFKSTTERPRIIDCGSYIGTSILYFKINYPHAIISGFEPDGKNYEIIHQNLENWKFHDTTVENAAIWIKNDYLAFDSKGNMGSKLDVAQDHDVNKKSVKCVRLKDLLNEEIDFLKIDIEGAEYEVLKDCSDKLVNVKNLFVEYHGLYSENYKLNEILSILTDNNFNYYIKEGSPVHKRPFWDKDKKGDYDIILNIFAFKIERTEE
jgi:FkbM family methyltransferase